MPDTHDRANFFKQNPRARAWAALDEATNQQKKITPGAIRVRKGRFSRKRAVILGAFPASEPSFLARELRA